MYKVRDAVIEAIEVPSVIDYSLCLTMAIAYYLLKTTGAGLFIN